MPLIAGPQDFVASLNLVEQQGVELLGDQSAVRGAWHEGLAPLLLEILERIVESFDLLVEIDELLGKCTQEG